MKSPLISICLPLYNSGRHVQGTIASIAAQTCHNWELILVDDCSSDQTVSVVTRMIEDLRDPRVKFYTNATRLGMVENWNRTTAEAAGEFIKLIGQDDLLSPDCLESQCAIMQRHPEVTIVTCARRVVDPGGKPLMVRKCFPREGVFNGRETIRRCLSSGTNIIGEPVSVLFRRSTLGAKNLFEPSILYCTDLDLWLRLLGKGDLYYMLEPKTSYRIHRGAATRSLKHEVFEDFFRLVDRMVERGYFQITRFGRVWLGAKVRLFAFARSVIYALLARG